jgi:hypothetical protein
MFANFGWKTLAVAAVMVLLAIAALIGVDITPITTLQPGELLLGAASLLGLRGGIARILPPTGPSP